MPTLIVEDGTMPQGANAYASAEIADFYHILRGTDDWPQYDDDGSNQPDPNIAKKEAALIRASDYINGLSYPGKKAAGGRVMAWPRVGFVDLCDEYAIDADTIPDAIRDATCYLAGVIYAGTEAQPTLERGGRVQSESVGSLSTSFFEDAANRDVFSAVADLLKCYAYGLDRFAGVGENAPSKGFSQGGVLV